MTRLAIVSLFVVVLFCGAGVTSGCSVTVNPGAGEGDGGTPDGGVGAGDEVGRGDQVGGGDAAGDPGSCEPVECSTRCNVVIGEDGCPACECPENPCSGLDFCDCFQHPDCTYLTDTCICPCDYECPGEPPCDCDCGGGDYLGCYPVSCEPPYCEPGCEFTFSFDEDGCPICESWPCCEYECNLDCECKKDHRGCDIPECADGLCELDEACFPGPDPCGCAYDCISEFNEIWPCSRMCENPATVPIPYCVCRDGVCERLSCFDSNVPCPEGYHCDSDSGMCEAGPGSHACGAILLDPDAACLPEYVVDRLPFEVNLAWWSNAGCLTEFVGCGVEVVELAGPEEIVGEIHLFPMVTWCADEAIIDCSPGPVFGSCEVPALELGTYRIFVNQFVTGGEVTVREVPAGVIPDGDICRSLGWEETPGSICDEVRIAPLSYDRHCGPQIIAAGQRALFTFTNTCGDCFTYPGECRVRVEPYAAIAKVILEVDELYCNCYACGACPPSCEEVAVECLTPPITIPDHYEVLVNGSFLADLAVTSGVPPGPYICE